MDLTRNGTILEILQSGNNASCYKFNLTKLTRSKRGHTEEKKRIVLKLQFQVPIDTDASISITAGPSLTGRGGDMPYQEFL